MYKTVLLASMVSALHVLWVWTFIHGGEGFARPSQPVVLVTAFIQPTLTSVAHHSDDPDLSQLSYVVDRPRATLHIDVPRIQFTVSRNSAAAVAAPSLSPDPPVDIGPYVRRAALLPGEGATVVLRIEVLEDGSPGQIAIDVSSGSAQVDQAATEYARAHRWVAAVVGGAPHSMWIRWGVRLQA